MNREQALKIILKALDRYYANTYNGYALKNDKNNAMYTAIEASEVANYVKDNLK